MLPNTRKLYIVDWTIENFSMETGCTLIFSKDFKTGDMQETKWKAVMLAYDNKTTEDEKDWVSVGIVRHFDDDGPIAIQMFCDMSIVAADGSEHMHTEIVMREAKLEDKCMKRLVERDFLFENRWRFLPKDMLTIRLRLASPHGKHFYSSVARTLVDHESYCFDWCIDGFTSPNLEKQDAVKRFGVENTNGLPSAFEVVLKYPKKDTGEEMPKPSDEHQLELSVSDLKKDLHVWARVSVMSSKKTHELSKEADYVFTPEASSWTFPMVIPVDKLLENAKELLPEGKLTLKCMFLVSHKEHTFSMEEEPFLFNGNYTVENLSNAVRGLRRSCDYTDVKLRTEDGQTFPCHRWILASRSRVLMTMFEKLALDSVLGQSDFEIVNMDGSVNSAPSSATQSVVEVPDVDPGTLNKFLDYLYTETCEKDLTFDCYLSLFSAAAKFGVLALKSKCLELLKGKFDYENIYRALTLADRASEPQLRLAAQDFIAEHSEVIMLTDEWHDFVVQETTLAKIVMCDLKVRHQERCSEAFVM